MKLAVFPSLALVLINIHPFKKMLDPYFIAWHKNERSYKYLIGVFFFNGNVMSWKCVLNVCHVR